MKTLKFIRNAIRFFSALFYSVWLLAPIMFSLKFPFPKKTKPKIRPLPLRLRVQTRAT